MRLVVLILTTVLMSGCSGLFLYPDRYNYFPDVFKYVELSEGNIPTTSGAKLHYWMIPAQHNKQVDKVQKGLVVQIHGNGQNLTSHVRGLGWITEAGYALAAFDYRGYGQSNGEAALKNAYADVATALDYFSQLADKSNLPIIFYGQSLGGTLLLKTFSSHPGRWKPKAIVVEGSFYSYSGIAREKLASRWYSWPLQWLAYLLITDKYSLEKSELQSISPTPVYMFYSEKDPIVPVHHGQKIFANLPDANKQFFSYPEFGHINSMWVQEGRFRKVLLDLLDKTSTHPNKKIDNQGRCKDQNLDP